MSYPPARGSEGSRPNTRMPNVLPDYPGGPAYQRREADLARVRENQRRSRARRREYVMDLENRLRQYEVLGIEASTEVALGARRVTEENRKLRELLHAHGVDDRHIAHYVQNASGAWDVAPGAIPPMAMESPVQSLEQLLAPRRLASLEPVPLTVTVVPSQGSRENSAPSQASSTSPAWHASSTTADTSSYTSPLISNATSRSNPEDPASYSYPTPYATSLSNSYLPPVSTSESLVPRAQRVDISMPLRTLEEDEHHGSNLQSLLIEEDTRLGCTAPANTYRGGDPYRSSRQ